MSTAVLEKILKQKVASGTLKLKCLIRSDNTLRTIRSMGVDVFKNGTVEFPIREIRQGNGNFLIATEYPVATKQKSTITVGKIEKLFCVFFLKKDDIGEYDLSWISYGHDIIWPIGSFIKDDYKIVISQIIEEIETMFEI